VESLQIIFVQSPHVGDSTIHGVDYEAVRVVIVFEGGVVTEDAEDGRPGYGHRCPVEVNMRDNVTRVGWRLQTV